MTAERTVDLALPTGLPLSQVLPQLLRYAAPSTGGDGAPTSWTLSKLGGQQVPLSQTLTDAAVLDGDVLELRPQGTESRPVMVDDVRDAVEDRVDAAGGIWTNRTTGSFTVLVGCLLLGLLAVVVVLAGMFTTAQWPTQIDSLSTAVSAVVTLVFATWWAAQHTGELVAQVAAAVAMAWGGMLGLFVAHAVETDYWLTITICALAAAVVAGASRALTEVTTGHLAFGAVLLISAVVMLLAETGDLGQRVGPRLLPVLALLSIGAIPRVSLSVGGLSSADYRVRNVGVLDLASLQARYRMSNAILGGMVTAISVVIVWFGTGLTLSTSSWDRYLALGLAAGMVLRSRAFSRTQHMLPLRVAGLALVSLALVRCTIDRADLAPWLGVAVAGALLAGIGLASIQLSEIPAARVKRTLNVAESLVLIVILVLMFGSFTVYAQFEGMFG
ncbi:MAG: type VII secretion integral membrane protein EccD [Nocardioides sp.]|nr:type VII secretion integral membrane protein EccD [Nocardioides sp.]